MTGLSEFGLKNGLGFSYAHTAENQKLEAIMFAMNDGDSGAGYRKGFR
jgi:hypothetical protein